jgi:cytochrome o ubiquinol oxidase operon protein cyoD
MTATHYDRAPGDASRPTELRREASSSALAYSIGLFLAAILTAISFWAANTSLLWPPGVPLGLTALAITQMGIHLVFFLHITSGPDSTNNVLALAFGVLIVTLVMAGSLWIMTNLDQNMKPIGEMRRPHRVMNNQMAMAVWRAGIDKIEATAKAVDMPLRLDNANALPTYPQQKQKQQEAG